jgi:hypothetical protein
MVHRCRASLCGAFNPAQRAGEDLRRDHNAIAASSDSHAAGREVSTTTWYSP